MLAERLKLNADIQRILDEQTEAWGIKVSNVEIERVDLDEDMIRAIARQAEAERRSAPRSSMPRASCRRLSGSWRWRRFLLRSRRRCSSVI